MASAEPFIGSIDFWAPNFAPRGWSLCNGQLLAISTNTALFSLIGTFFGGNGTSTFALPDMRGRVPIGAGQGPGLSNYEIGEMGGQEQVTLTIANLPNHTHTATGTVTPQATEPATRDASTSPIGNYNGPTENATYEPAPTGAMGSSPVNITIAPAGGGQPFPILQPYLALNCIIALVGIYPSRN